MDQEDNEVTPLAKEVQKWAQDSGLALEMSLASALREAGFKFVMPGLRFLDSESGKPRESDVVAVWKSSSLFVGSTYCRGLAVVITVECKGGKGPLVAFTDASQTQEERESLRLGGNLYPTLRSLIASEALQYEIEELPSGVKWQELPPLHLFRLMQDPGVGLRTMSKGKDVAYEAIMQTIKSAAAIATVEIGRNRKLRQTDDLVLALPCILTSSPLLEVELRDGRAQAREISDALVSFDPKIPGLGGRTCVYVQTNAKELAKIAAETCDFLFETLRRPVMSSYDPARPPEGPPTKRQRPRP